MNVTLSIDDDVIREARRRAEALLASDGDGLYAARIRKILAE